MKLLVAIGGLFVLMAPSRADASWFESCQIYGRVIQQSQASRRTYYVKISVTSSERTDDNLGRTSYTSCEEYVGTEQAFQIEVPRSTRISVGGNLTIARTAVDGFNIKTGDMSTTVKYWFKNYQEVGGER